VLRVELMFSAKRPSSPALLVASVAIAVGCSTVTEPSIARSVAPAPGRSWQPPEDATPPAPPNAKEKEPEIPPEYLKEGATLSLGQVVDLALRNNPLTRQAWFDARAAAAELGAKYAAWYPSLELDAQIQRQKQAALGGQFTFLQTTYGPTLSLSYLLLDFGGRSADIEEARRALYAADFAHNAVIQDLVLFVASEYYQYLNAKAQRSAAQASLKQAREALAAAEGRHESGVATIADVLQARTAASQAELVLQTVEGQAQVIRGSLATALGVPATIPIEAGELPEAVDVDRAIDTVDSLIAKAEAQRPDLASARSLVLKAEAHARSVRSEGLPVLLATGTLNRTYYYNNAPRAPYSDNYAGAILFRFPVFSGFDKTFETRKAAEEAASAAAAAETLNDRVVLQVWTSYYAVKTVSALVKTSRDLLASATQSQDVALGRYKEGVGSILDLLAAQSAYANARSQEAQARANWFLALAQLAHDTGSLGQASESERKP
jgi:outer membrane protein